MTSYSYKEFFVWATWKPKWRENCCCCCCCSQTFARLLNFHKFLGLFRAVEVARSQYSRATPQPFTFGTKRQSQCCHLFVLRWIICSKPNCFFGLRAQFTQSTVYHHHDKAGSTPSPHSTVSHAPTYSTTRSEHGTAIPLNDFDLFSMAKSS